MSYKRLAFLAALALTASGMALAHAHLQRSEPADQSVLAAAPKMLVLAFTEAVTITALNIQQGDAKAQALGPLSKSPAKEQSFTLPALKAGGYTVTWRAMSDDNHLMSGKLTFKLGAP